MSFIHYTKPLGILYSLTTPSLQSLPILYSLTTTSCSSSSDLRQRSDLRLSKFSPLAYFWVGT